VDFDVGQDDQRTDGAHHRCPEGCQATGRYAGGYDAGGGYEAAVILEERTCGIWIVASAEVTRPKR